MSDDQGKPETVHCDACGEACRFYLMCGIDDGEWCAECFAKTPCGKGDHGEGCPTKVFSCE